MTVQRDFLGIQELEELSFERSEELRQALEDLLSPNVEMRHRGMNRLREMDAHRRSPLAACFLVYRMIEEDLNIRAEIVHSIFEIIKRRGIRERPPVKVREYLHQSLLGIGEREIYALLELACEDDEFLEPVCAILNQCSTSGELLVEILDCGDYSIPIRMASCKVIGEIGFLAAKEAIEALHKRLTDRTSGQLAMAFAPRALEEARELIPTLRSTLDALREASF